jgi:hypothetical protein
VPLTWHFCHALPPPRQEPPATAAARLLPLLDGGGRRINPALLPPDKRFGAGVDSDEDWGRWDGAKKGGVRCAARHWVHPCFKLPPWLLPAVPW